MTTPDPSTTRTHAPAADTRPAAQLGAQRPISHASGGFGALLQRKCACGGAAGMSGECAQCAKRRLYGVQARLRVGPPDDAFEREAERVADRVSAGSRGDLATRASGEPGQPPAAHIQRLPAGPAGAPAATGSDAALLPHGPGEPLSADVRSDMEARFGHDFSRVRIHTGAEADRSAALLGAEAYTTRNDIVFANGRFAPRTSTGRHLLAHELTHVVQQAGTAGPAGDLIRRSSKKSEPSTKPHSCGGWTCANTATCRNPDGKSAPTGTASTSWKLAANLDLDVPTAADVSGGDDVGHAFVEFSESNGDRYTYGHYHNRSRTPDPVFRPQVPGCTAHPDDTHARCIDMHIEFSLSEAEYRKALEFAQSWCVASPPYNILSNNCTSFVEHVAKAAGKTLPSSRGKVGSGTLSTTADNPYTLFDAHLAKTDKDTWRARVTGGFEGHYDTGGNPIAFDEFKLVTDEKLVVGGLYRYEGSSGDPVEGDVDGQLRFIVDGTTKKVDPFVTFKWNEPGGSGRGRWSVSPSAELKGTWGRGAADSGAGNWTLKKK